MEPIIFKIERSELLTIVKITGKTKAVPFGDSYILSKAMEIIDILERSGGKILALEGEEKIEKIPDQILVRFRMIFKTQQKLEKAMRKIKEELG